MKELIKKILTSKAARNTTALSAFAMSIATVGIPWSDI